MRDLTKLSKLNEWEQKKQLRRTEDLDRLLEVIGSGLPFRCKIVIDVSIPPLPYPYELGETPVPPSKPKPVDKPVSNRNGNPGPRPTDHTVRPKTQTEFKPAVGKSKRHGYLTHEQVQYIRAECDRANDKNLRARQLAEEIGVRPSTIRKVMHRQTYTDVPEQQEENHGDD